MLVATDRLAATTAQEVKAALETGDAEAKAFALQRAIGMLLAGEPISGLFISIVRFVLPSEDHNVQKLLLLYLVRGVFSVGAVLIGAREGAGARGVESEPRALRETSATSSPRARTTPASTSNTHTQQILPCSRPRHRAPCLTKKHLPSRRNHKHPTPNQNQTNRQKKTQTKKTHRRPSRRRTARASSCPR